jgi:cytolysin-activating lysine-acyltransferase
MTDQTVKDSLQPGQNSVDIQIPEMDNADQLQQQAAPSPTMGSMLGDIVWLMSQSPAHKHYALSDLEWMVMPALILGQYRIFRDGKKPVGVALWAYLSKDVEEKLASGAGRMRPDEWSAGSKLNAEKGIEPGEGGTLWLVDLISPFATEENKLIQKCLGDLMSSVFKGKNVKFHQTDMKTKERKVIEIKG